jgi:hypothetical protein
MILNQDAYDELCCYTLSHRDTSFIHQHVVDAFAAQTADERTKLIGLAFALIGLYLHQSAVITSAQSSLLTRVARALRPRQGLRGRTRRKALAQGQAA